MISDKNIFNQLKSLQAVQPSAGWRANNRQLLLNQIKSAVEVDRASALSELQHYLRYWILNVPRLAAKPVGIMILAISVVMGSGVAVVGASGNSLPGDYLYNIKIATETVQSSLTADPQDKVYLEIMFANRRVEEMKQVGQTTESAAKKHKRVARAADGLTQNLKNIQNNLNTIKNNKENSSDRVAAAVNLVDNQVDQLNQSMKAEMTDKQEGDQTAATGAQQAMNETSDQVLDIMTDQYQNGGLDYKAKENILNIVNSKIEQAKEKIGLLILAIVDITEVKIQNQPSTNPETGSTEVAGTIVTKEEISKNLESAKKLLAEAQKVLKISDIVLAVEKLKAGKVIIALAEGQIEELADLANNAVNQAGCQDNKCADFDVDQGSGVGSTTSSTAAGVIKQPTESELAGQTAAEDTAVKAVGDQMEVASGTAEAVETDGGILLNTWGE